MAKPLNEFGGWLRFFQVTNIIGAVLLSVAILALLIATMFHANLKVILQSLMIITESGLTLYFIIRIIGVLKSRGKEVPGKIISWLGYSLTVTVVFSAMEITLNMASHAWVWTGEDMASLRLTFQALIYYAIWSSYFRNSKRAAAYYDGGAQPASQAPQPQNAVSDAVNPG